MKAASMTVQVDMTALDNQTLLVAFNDATDSRSFLTLAASCDAGRSWSRAAVLEDHCGGSFSYPTMQDLPEQVILIHAGLLYHHTQTVPTPLTLPSI